MKKILFVIDSLNCGGAEKSLVSLLTLFDYKKYQVHLLMFSPEGLYLSILPEQVNVLKVPDYLKKQSNGVKSLMKNWEIKKLYLRSRASISLRNPYYKRMMHQAQINWRWVSKGIDKAEEQYDVAVAYSQGTPTYFVAEKVKANRKVCWINTDYKKAKYNKKFDTRYYKQFDNIVAVSDYNKEVFLNEIPSLEGKTCVVYDIISPKLVKSMALQDNGFEDDFNGIRIVTIGRLVDAKGYDMAIQACYKLKKQGYQFKWYVIGEGSLKAQLEHMIESHQLEDTFILLGIHQNPYVFLKQCDIYVQPSRFEGYGLAIAEARILQKPIVATNFTVVHNQIKNKENGLIVNMDSESISNGIKKIIEDKRLKTQLHEKLAADDVGTEHEINKIYSIIENTNKVN